MERLRNVFQRKHGIAKKIFSFVLAVAMVITLVPISGGTVKAADDAMNVNIHVKIPSENFGWTTPAIQYWKQYYRPSPSSLTCWYNHPS